MLLSLQRKLKDGANKNEHLAQLADHLGNTGSAVAYNYDIIHGYSATLKGSALDFVQSSKDVEYIELDNILSLTFELVPILNCINHVYTFTAHL